MTTIRLPKLVNLQPFLLECHLTSLVTSYVFFNDDSLIHVKFMCVTHTHTLGTGILLLGPVKFSFNYTF